MLAANNAGRTPGRCPGPSGPLGSRRRLTTSCGASASLVRPPRRRRTAARSPCVPGRPDPGSPRRVDLVGSSRDVPTLWPLSGEEGEGHGPADEDPVGHADQAGDRRFELVRDLRAAEHDHVGSPDVRGQPPQRGDLGPDQVAGGAAAGAGRCRRRWRACGARRRSRPRRTGRPARRARSANRPRCVSSLLVSLALNRRFSSMTRPPGQAPRRRCADGPVCRRRASPGGRAARRGGPRPAPASTSGPACPWGGRGERRRSPWRRGRVGRSGSAERPGSGRRL
jgi:hypothetical protein